MNRAGYDAASNTVALFDRTDRPRLEIVGPDRARFLHNLTTNDVKRLTEGQGCETFVTSLQGKTLGYVTLVARADRILLRTDPGGLDLLLPHFAKYGAFDDVAIEDVTAGTVELHLAGPRAALLIESIAGALPDPAELSAVETRVAGHPALLIREAPIGRPGFSLIIPESARNVVCDALRAVGASLGLVESDGECWDALRIEAGRPVFGQDVTADHLPQEVGRDRQAISFVKGCYLGQETVARIDALGHVNKLLRGLRIESDRVPPPGTVLMAEGKGVGTVTSSAFSPGWGGPVALGYVRVARGEPGQTLQVGEDPSGLGAVVVELPMLPPNPS